MAIRFPNSIELNTDAPLDIRQVVADQAARLNMKYVYSGLMVYQQDNEKLYIAIKDDGNVTWREIRTSDADLFVVGYYFNNEFYSDSTYQTKLEKNDKRIYIDINGSHSGGFYSYRYVVASDKYEPIIGQASDIVAGVVKLYKTNGSNEDGAMTQKAVTDGVKAIQFGVEFTEDTNNDGQITEDDDGCLVLNLPW